MIPLSTEYAIREAVRLLRASRRNFKSRQIETARELLEKVLYVASHKLMGQTVVEHDVREITIMMGRM